MAGPTIYPELNEVLSELVDGVTEILGDSLCGIYLQGSFAVGDADEHSDVDFIVVTEREIPDEVAERLQAMHQRIYDLPSAWAQHLEGSYITRELVQTVDSERRPLLYLDNGAIELERDNHCNTAVVRWSLHERGVALKGPPPKTLVEPVSADDLRADVAVAMREWCEWLAEVPAMSRRSQGVLVLTICRMLHTVASGRVGSKREAGEWALTAVDPEWRGLIEDALADRPDPWVKVRELSEPEVLARTLAFFAYARALLE